MASSSSSITVDFDAVRGGERIQLKRMAPDRELLLVRWPGDRAVDVGESAAVRPVPGPDSGGRRYAGCSLMCSSLRGFEWIKPPEEPMSRRRPALRLSRHRSRLLSRGPLCTARTTGVLTPPPAEEEVPLRLEPRHARRGHLQASPARGPWRGRRACSFRRVLFPGAVATGRRRRTTRPSRSDRSATSSAPFRSSRRSDESRAPCTARPRERAPSQARPELSCVIPGVGSVATTRPVFGSTFRILSSPI